MTNYNKLTKAQLIELLHERDDEIAELKEQLKSVEADYDDDVKRLYGRIRKFKNEIQSLKDKYENITLETFIKDGLLLATESTTEKIHNKWYERTGENVRFDTINEIIESMKIDITQIKRRIYDNEYSDLYKDNSHNSKINLQPEGLIYINQLEGDVDDGIFKPGKTDDPMRRDNNYWNKHKQTIFKHDLFWVPNQRICENKILKRIKDSGYVPIIRKGKKIDKDEHTNEFFKILYEELHKIVVETVKECGGYQYDVAIVLKNHTKGRFINKQILSE